MAGHPAAGAGAGHKYRSSGEGTLKICIRKDNSADVSVMIMFFHGGSYNLQHFSSDIILTRALYKWRQP